MNPGSSDLRVRALNQGSLETAAAIIAGWRDGGEARPWGEPGPGLEMTNWREEATAEGAVSTARPGAVGEACMLGAFICSTCPHAGPLGRWAGLGLGDTGLRLPAVRWGAKQRAWDRA